MKKIHSKSEGKLRGQLLIYGLFIFFLAFIFAIALLPGLQTMVVESTSNSTLFPTTGPTFLVSNLYGLLFIAGPILAFITYASFQRQGQ